MPFQIEDVAVNVTIESEYPDRIVTIKGLANNVSIDQENGSDYVLGHSIMPGLYDKQKFSGNFIGGYTMSIEEKGMKEPVEFYRTARVVLDRVTMKGINEAHKKSGAPSNAEVSISPALDVSNSGLVVNQKNTVTFNWTETV